MTPAEIAYNLGRIKQIPGEAVFSNDKIYRYILTRTWGTGDKTCTFIMCNPSTADESILDPTVRKCLEWSILWKYDRLIILNLFALRSTNPAKLYTVMDPVGPDNDFHIMETMENNKNGLFIAAWGTHSEHLNREDDVRLLADRLGIALNYMRLTPKSGHPEHPLYIPKSLTPTLWRKENGSVGSL